MRKTKSSEKPKIADGGNALLSLLLLEAHADVVEAHLRAAWSARKTSSSASIAWPEL